MKTTIITALLLLATVSGAVAQEKWEYAVMYIDPTRSSIIIVTNTRNESKKIESKYNDYAGQAQELLREATKASDEGWEAINGTLSSGLPYHILYLKRKVKS